MRARVRGVRVMCSCSCGVPVVMFSWWYARAFLVFVVSSRWCGRGGVLRVECAWYFRGVGRCVRGVRAVCTYGRAWSGVNVALGRSRSVLVVLWSW